MEQILIESLKEMDDVNIIDIRDQEKYNKNHILKAINIPKDVLMNSPETYLSKDSKYYIYCEIGLLSREVCTKLTEYNLVNCIGGYKRWVETC